VDTRARRSTRCVAYSASLERDLPLPPLSFLRLFRADQRGNSSRACSHSRALDLFLESLASADCRLVGFPCPGLRDFRRNFVHGDCFSCDSGACAVLGRPPADGAPGGWSGGPGRGPLFLVTRETKPYCGETQPPRTRHTANYAQ
jgi:hypothetical protein